MNQVTISPDDFPRFVPAPGVRGPHRQTIAGAYLPGPHFPYRACQHRLRLPDGDLLVLHEDLPEHWRPGDRSALLVHGLCGCHGSPYMARLAGKLHARGVRVFRLDLRGCGAGFGLAQQVFHAGRSDDALAAAGHIAQLTDNSPLTLVGFSMGGNIILKLMGELGAAAPGALPCLDSALAVAPPIDLPGCAASLQRGLNRVYDRTFLRSLLKLVARRRQALPAAPHIELRPRPRSLQEFDDRFTAPLAGYQGAHQYYLACSAGPGLVRIRRPTLVITARDDPLIPFSSFAATPLSSHIRLLVTEYGGHLGYLGRRGTDPDRRWLDWRAVEWITGLPPR